MNQIILTKPINGNPNNIFKMKYIGYTEKQAKARFKVDFANEESKYFINSK